MTIPAVKPDPYRKLLPQHPILTHTSHHGIGVRVSCVSRTRTTWRSLGRGALSRRCNEKSTTPYLLDSPATLLAFERGVPYCPCGVLGWWRCAWYPHLGPTLSGDETDQLYCQHANGFLAKKYLPKRVIFRKSYLEVELTQGVAPHMKGHP